MSDLSGAEQIAAERAAHTTREGWTTKHDDAHVNVEMGRASHRYLTHAINQAGWRTGHWGELMWPWASKWWKPSPDPIRNLVKAGALIAAEIDRLQRLATKETP